MARLSFGITAAFVGAVSASGWWPVGNMKIYVANTTDVDLANKVTPIACLDVHGGATANMDNCAVFNKDSNTPYAASTSAGPCTFFDTNWIENLDYEHGAGTYAFHCAEGLQSRPDGENWASTKQPEYPFFYLDYYGVYDLKMTDPQGSNPVWIYGLNGYDDGTYPGHNHVILKWVAE